MEFREIKPARIYLVGINKDIKISDCGKVYLKANEQVTFVTSEGREHDFCAKSWGFYSTPSVNGRLKDQGFKTALVKNSLGRFYIMVVDRDKMGDFEAYLKSDKNAVVQWLDEL